MPPDPRFLRGALPTPRNRLLAATPHRATFAPPPQVIYIPPRLDMWGNDQYGDCVSAEEAFAKACHSPEIFIDARTVIDWASRHGWLNGANLTPVMDAMQRDGFKVGGQVYDDGPYTGVDYGDQTVLRSAIALGPVKIAIAADALPSGAGNHQGWYAVGGGHHPNTDHCVALCGYGPAGWLYHQLGVPLPTGLAADKDGYLLYTWSTIGFVDHQWIMGTCAEAWLRNPTTVGVPPLPDPVPPVPPVPPIPPVPPVPPVPPIPAPGTYSFSGTIAGLLPFSGTLTPVVVVSAGPIIPPWLMPLLEIACAYIKSGGGGNLPPWLRALALALCGYLPAGGCAPSPNRL